MYNELKSIYNIYPRQFFTNRSWDVHSFDEFISAFKTNISLGHCGASTYNHPEAECDFIIDRIAFDLDSENAHQEAIKLHEYLLNCNAKHYMIFSGRHFHIYAKVEYQPIFKKDYIRALSLMIEKEVGFENDDVVRSNLNHKLAIPFSFNYKPTSMRYVTPLTDKQLYWQYDDICELAKQQTTTIPFYGTEGFQMEELDKPSANHIELEGIAEVSSFNDKLLDALPLRARRALQNPELKHPDRLFLITQLMEFGCSKQQCVAILRKHLSPKKFRHAVYEEKQVENIYAKQYDILTGD